MNQIQLKISDIEKLMYFIQGFKNLNKGIKGDEMLLEFESDRIFTKTNGSHFFKNIQVSNAIPNNFIAYGELKYDDFCTITGTISDTLYVLVSDIDEILTNCSRVLKKNKKLKKNPIEPNIYLKINDKGWVVSLYWIDSFVEQELSIKHWTTNLEHPINNFSYKSKLDVLSLPDKVVVEFSKSELNEHIKNISKDFKEDDKTGYLLFDMKDGTFRIRGKKYAYVAKRNCNIDDFIYMIRLNSFQLLSNDDYKLYVINNVKSSKTNKIINGIIIFESLTTKRFIQIAKSVDPDGSQIENHKMDDILMINFN